MSETKRRWKLWQKLVLAACLLLAILFGALTGLRRPWIEPLPGVSLELARPVVDVNSVPPDSAHAFLLAAIEEPEGARLPEGTEPVWAGDWRDARM